MQILRIDFEDGSGPYRDGYHELERVMWGKGEEAVPSYVRTQGYATTRHPTYIQSGLEDRPQYWEQFGFESRQDMINWFFPQGMEDARLLEEFGLLVRIYDVPKDMVRCGSQQLIYGSADATLVDTFTPTYFYENECINVQ